MSTPSEGALTAIVHLDYADEDSRLSLAIEQAKKCGTEYQIVTVSVFRDGSTLLDNIRVDRAALEVLETVENSIEPGKKVLVALSSEGGINRSQFSVIAQIVDVCQAVALNSALAPGTVKLFITIDDDIKRSGTGLSE